MSGIGISLTCAFRRPGENKIGWPISANAIALTTLGQPDVSEGFAADSRVSAYTATEGRFRRAPEGLVRCAADEERLCFAGDGAFVGQYLQGADTYHSAPWDDPAATHGSGDAAYFAPRSGGSIAYAGAHSEPDIFGGSGGGVVITQTDADGSFHNANNVKVSGVLEGDVLRHEVIVSIETTEAGKVGPRGHGNSNFSFDFDHDAQGNITGFTENWATYRAGYHDMGIINGKRWWYLWADRLADSTGDTQGIGINYSGTTAGQGRKVHVCEAMIRKNPACAPAAVPVCAASKTFTADTLVSTLSNAGYICEGLAMARSQVPGGAIEAPAVPLGVPYEPLETRIGIATGAEAADRTGLLDNPNLHFYARPWEQPASITLHYGPGYIASRWLVADDINDRVGDATIAPVFQARRDLAPVLGKHATSGAYVTGALTLDGCVFLALGDTVSTYWRQTDIRTFGNSTSFLLAAGTALNARGCLVMGETVHTTRARSEAQADESDEQRVYVGEFLPFIENAGSIDLSGSRFERLARMSMEARDRNTAVALNLDDTCYSLMWSDPIYWSRGTFANVQASRRFHGSMTFHPGMSIWQSRKQIEVDTGSGFVPFDASGLTLADLPHGHEAQLVGMWDFDTDTFTAAPDPAKTCRIRYYAPGSGIGTSRPGYEWNAQQVDMGGYSRHQQTGDVYEIDTGTLKARFTFDRGRYSAGNVWNVDTNPALTSTGTHGDNDQVNRFFVTINGMVADDVVMLNHGQGPFHTGTSSLAADGSSITGIVTDRFVAVLADVSNAYRFDHSLLAGSVETLQNSLLVQAYSDYRFEGGDGIAMNIGAAGANNTLQLGANVWSATAHPTGLSDSGGGTTTGTLNRIGLPRAQGFSGYTTPGASDGVLTDLLDPADIHASGQAEPVTDPWTFAFADGAAAKLGFDPNATLALARGNHAAWDDVIAGLAAVYHRKPDHLAEIAPGAAVGSVVATGVAASAFHARYGGNGEGYFALDGGQVTVAKPLTGVDRIFVLRGDNDETIMVDVA
ncbi:hypothetical protein [Aurantiacibacter aquimixticola]|uniref:Uncharacterized protein n=1 Tax=Aurantiacibacter aquimixticola TaxID=1958945 RepID=A0A419RUJ3_9SPHN|nr:hypothetical protein [Aurantiacibacter aquimixticola]RJY09458.1 hypothetical protein D6201_08895 [Aurantiacibacter aquimixticola]